ncbi:hypothetical protein [Algivirga pacifica]|uniref:Lipocalin-like domain-containing protein n=1 Tax=Algivirga pacifica TaxID=1162670 RepID=A0ABP9DD62_9BACT
MRKFTTRLLTVVAVGSVAFTACNKENDPTATEITSADVQMVNNDVVVDAEFENAEAFALQNMSSSNNNFRVTEGGPKVEDWVIQAGSISFVLNFEGVMIEESEFAGKIAVVASFESLQEAVAGKLSLVTDFQDYTVDGVVLNGTRTRTFTAVEGEGSVYDVTLEDGSITFADGSTASRSAAWTLTAGTLLDSETPRTLVGTAEGVNKAGVSYKTTVDSETPVASTLACDIAEKMFWLPTSGQKSIEADGKTLTVDFGEGTCDKLAVVSLVVGDSTITKEISLDRWSK